jgi:hypothetical protein
VDTGRPVGAAGPRCCEDDVGGTRAVQVNWMHLFFGAASGFATTGAGLGGGGISALSSALGFAAQAKEMHLFFSNTSMAGSLVCGAFPASMLILTVPGLGATITLFPAAAMGTKPTSGSWGLGELVRAGVVKPVSQVRSPPEERLKLLVTERLLLGLCTEPSFSEWLWRALVKSDSCCSLPRRMGVRENWADWDERQSGGSSTSAEASSSANGSALADCAAVHARTLDAV